MANGTILFNDPQAQLRAVGKENTELHAELSAVYRELDRYRNALTRLADYPDGKVQQIAKGALAG